MPAPDPTRLYPVVYGLNYGRAQGWPVVFLKPLVRSPFHQSHSPGGRDGPVGHRAGTRRLARVRGDRDGRVNIGHGAIVAARPVVSSDVPSYAIVAGNPARVVRMRFSPEQIERLLAMAWRDWPVELVGKQLRTIMGNDVDELERVAKTNRSLAG